MLTDVFLMFLCYLGQYILVMPIQKVVAFRGPFFQTTSVRFCCAKDIYP